MGDLDEAVGLAARVAQRLEAGGIDDLIGGSVATGAYGEPRATNDLDVTVRVPASRVRDVPRLLGPEFAVDEEALDEAVRLRRSTNIFYLPSFLKIALFVRRQDPYDRAEFGRKVRIEPAPGLAFYASSVDDNLLWKLRWFRMGGEVSDQQWRDVLGVLRVSGPVVEPDTLRKWARHHGVDVLLDRALAQASLA